MAGREVRVSKSPLSGGLFRLPVSMRLVALFAVVGLVSSLGATPRGGEPETMDSLSPDSARFVVRIERKAVATMNVIDTLDVTVESYGRPYAGCSFKIGTNSPYIDIIEILRGRVIDSCGWELFHADRIESNGSSRYPRTLWSAVALAKLTPDTLKPHCLGFRREGTVFRLVVSSAPTVQIKDSAAAIFFFWEDCRDNTLSDSTGNVLMVSRRVFDYYDPMLDPGADAFPTRLGTPSQCINLGLPSHPRRRVEFHNGGLKFDVKLTPKPIPDTSKKTK
jgi:hypothetical protein